LSKIKIILPIFILLLSLTIVSAADFGVTVKTVKNRIYLDEVAFYNLTIINRKETDERYQVYTPDISWIISTSPSAPAVDANDRKPFLLKIDPKTYVSVGHHSVKISVKETSTKELEQIVVPIYIKSSIPDTRTYEPSIELNIGMPSDIDPRENVHIEISLRNRNNLDIDELIVRLESELINKEYTMPFGGLEERTDELIFQLDSLEAPQDDTLIITLIRENETVNRVRKPFSIIEYSDLIEDVKVKGGFLKTSYTIEIFNDGNVKKIGDYKLKSNFFKTLVTFESPKAKTSKAEPGYLIFEYILEPQTKQTIKATFNYGIYIYTAIFIILIVILYYTYRSPVIVRKDAKVIGSIKEGVSEMKVMLHIKNRSQRTIENIRVIEKIPRLVKFEKGTYIGTLAPDKIIEHAKLGTTIRWNLKSLEPFEERIITYKIKSKLNIIGGFAMPRVIIRFETPNGKERTIFSNKCNITS